jgi:hypothetical protein
MMRVVEGVGSTEERSGPPALVDRDAELAELTRRLEQEVSGDGGA